MRAALLAIEQELDARNAYPLGAAAVRWRTLTRTLEQGRAPRVLVLGRRGAGKSTLVNALCDAPVSEVGDVSDATSGASVHRCTLDGVPVDLWDVPGLRAGGQGAHRLRVVDALTRAIDPDAVLALFQASEVDAGIDDDLRDLRGLLEALRSHERREPAWIAVVTKVDELAPADAIAPPFDAVDEKRDNLVRATRVLHAHLLREGLRPFVVVPLNGYVRFARGGGVDEDLRWNLAPLRRAIVCATAPLQREHAAARLRDELANRTAQACVDTGALFASLARSELSRDERPGVPTSAHRESPAQSVDARAIVLRSEASIHVGPDAALAALDRLLTALVDACEQSAARREQSTLDALRRQIAERLSAARAVGLSRAQKLEWRAQSSARRASRRVRDALERWSLSRLEPLRVAALRNSRT